MQTKSHSEGLISKLQWRRKCEMEKKDFGRYEQGVCTRSGSCRLMGKDYIFQGGCGELSRSNELIMRAWKKELKKVHENFTFTEIAFSYTSTWHNQFQNIPHYILGSDRQKWAKLGEKYSNIHQISFLLNLSLSLAKNPSFCDFKSIFQF